jgi:mannose-1-phosphate guanylyltransferase
MKAFLLVAGKGTRLRPLTDSVPKCLLPINGRPLLDIWLESCARYGIHEVLINLHHLPHLVTEYVERSPWDVRITTFLEETLLGSGGTLAANREFVNEEESFFVIYGDNLTNMDLGKMHEFHRNRGSSFTMGLFRTPTPSECGIAALNSEGLVTAFEEKPAQPASNLANAGIYITGPSIFQHIPNQRFVDFGKDVLPKLIGQMYGYDIEEYYIDIGTTENYARAQSDWLQMPQLSARTSTTPLS